jgi:hypothetical protein
VLEVDSYRADEGPVAQHRRAGDHALPPQEARERLHWTFGRGELGGGTPGVQGWRLGELHATTCPEPSTTQARSRGAASTSLTRMSWSASLPPGKTPSPPIQRAADDAAEVAMAAPSR